MLFLRQGATHKVVIGPVVAVANGYVPVTTLSLATADEAEVILHDNGTVVDISGYTLDAITTADGYYHLTLQSGISNTVGHMTVVINDDSLCLPVKAEFTVIEEAVYDAMFAASAAGYQVPIWAAANSTVNLSATTIKTATDVETDTADIQSKIGSPAGASVSADIAAVKVDTAAILTDTNELQTDWVNGGRLDLILDARASQTSVDDLPTNAELATALGTADDAVLAAVATVDTVVDAIKVKTDSLNFTVAGFIDANIQYVNDVAVTGTGAVGDLWGPA